MEWDVGGKVWFLPGLFHSQALIPPGRDFLRGEEFQADAALGVQKPGENALNHGLPPFPVFILEL